MNQLSPKVQLALLEADFDTHIGPDGWPFFQRLTEVNAQVTVSAAGASLITVEVRSRGTVTSHHLNAGELEGHTDEALTLMFQTIARFA
jgi:hypothetical protein